MGMNNLPYKIPYTFDVNQILDDINTTEHRLGLPGLESYSVNHHEAGFVGMCRNLCHLERVTGVDRYTKFNGPHWVLKEKGYKEIHFNTILEEVKDLYLGTVISEMDNYFYTLNNKGFAGTIRLVWLYPNKGYNFHYDSHVTQRAHIPLITNDKCFWLFEDTSYVGDYYPLDTLHMPADGSVWYMDPSKVKHTFLNLSDVPRLHLIFSNFNI